MVLVDRSQVNHDADGVKRLLKEIKFFQTMDYVDWFG